MISVASPLELHRVNRRSVLAGLVGSALVATSARGAQASDLRIQRLNWAGVRLQLGDMSLFIDPLASADVWDDSLSDPIVPVVPTRENNVLITHRHPDHCHPDTIRRLVGSDGTLFFPTAVGPQPVAAIKSRAAAPFEPQLIGEFVAAAVPAADGYGDPQSSWIVTAAGRRIIHCGDTLWHGFWWQIGRQFGPFDLAFLPINGAKFSWRKPASDVSAVLTPQQAAAAADILSARRVVPIHYGVQGAEGYSEVDAPLAQFQKAAAERSIRVDPLRPGEWLAW